MPDCFYFEKSLIPLKLQMISPNCVIKDISPSLPSLFTFFLHKLGL